MNPATTARRVGMVLLAALAFAVLAFALIRLIPRTDPLPSQLARHDEKAAATAAQAIGAQVETQNADATLHIDLTTKDIRDAFHDLPAPLPAPTAVADPRPLPAAPVDRVRDRLNEGIARANRAAGPSDAAD